jgi:hypothetical protein
MPGAASVDLQWSDSVLRRNIERSRQGEQSCRPWPPQKHYPNETLYWDHQTILPRGWKLLNKRPPGCRTKLRNMAESKEMEFASAIAHDKAHTWQSWLRSRTERTLFDKLHNHVGEGKESIPPDSLRRTGTSPQAVEARKTRICVVKIPSAQLNGIRSSVSNGPGSTHGMHGSGQTVPVLRKTAVAGNSSQIVSIPCQPFSFVSLCCL